TCVEQYGFAAEIVVAKAFWGDGAPTALGADDDGFEVGELVEGELGEIVAVGVAMEWAVEVGAGVGDHLDLRDLELGAFRVDFARFLAAQIIADERGGQPFVGDHAVLDGMAEIAEVL